MAQVDDVEAPRRVSPLPWRPTAALLGCVALTTAAITGVAVGVIFLVPGARAPGPAVTVLAWTLPGHALAVLAVLHVGLRRAGASWRDTGFTRPHRSLLHLLWQLPLLLVALLVVQGAATAVLGGAPSSGGGIESIANRVDWATGAAMVLSVVVLVPLWEEAVFRGLVLGGLRRRWPAGVAVLASAGCFALAHGVLVLLPYLLTLGVGLALLRLVHRTLWAPVLAHATINAITSVAIIGALRT